MHYRAALLCLLAVTGSAFRSSTVRVTRRREAPPCSRRRPAVAVLDPTASFLLAESAAAAIADPAEVAAVLQTFEPRGITAQDSAVFAVGVVPFLWATVEFWRRIAVGEPFGTGKDSVIIGEDANPDSSRGRRVLGKDAFLAAYVLFGIAGFSLFLTILASLQVTG
jgi:hypothetical protein